MPRPPRTGSCRSSGRSARRRRQSWLHRRRRPTIQIDSATGRAEQLARHRCVEPEKGCVRASRDQEDARPSAHRPPRRRRAGLAPPGGRAHRFNQPGRRPVSAWPLTRWQSSGSAAPTMMAEPCDLRLPASAGWPAAGRGTIHAVMLITGSSASSGSRVRGSRSYLADRSALGLPGLSSSFSWYLAGTGPDAENPEPALLPPYSRGQLPGSGAALSAYAPLPPREQGVQHSGALHSPGDAR